MMKKNAFTRTVTMTTNRQPKDRALQFEKITEKLPVLIADAEARLANNSLPIHVSESREGKIQCISSFNHLPLPSCWLKWLGHCNEDDVCGHCYACGAMTTYRQSMLKVLVNNTVIMKGKVIPELIPVVMGPCRHFAFGDCHNLNMALWTVAIAKKNIKHSKHVVITKQYHHYEHIKTIPKNMVIVGSNSRINDVTPILKANVHKTYAVVTALEPYCYDNNYFICSDKCLNCYLGDKGCFSREGPRVIVRLLQ
jgi:hypothetical protein